MGKKTKQEKQLKIVKKRLEQEQKAPKGRKPYAVVLSISGVVSLLLAGSDIFANKGASMLTSMCLMVAVGSLALAYKIYDDEKKRMRTIEALERERNDLLSMQDD